MKRASTIQPWTLVESFGARPVNFPHLAKSREIWGTRRSGRGEIIGSQAHSIGLDSRWMLNPSAVGAAPLAAALLALPFGFKCLLPLRHCCLIPFRIDPNTLARSSLRFC
jgi:hypothetical protein